MFKGFKKWYQEKNKELSDFEYYQKVNIAKDLRNSKNEYTRKTLFYAYGFFPLSMYTFISTVALTSLIYIIILVNIYPYLSISLLKQLMDIRLIAFGIVISIMIPILIYEFTLTVISWSIKRIQLHDSLEKELKNE